MPLEDDELYQTAVLQQNYNARANSLYNGSVFDFFSRQAKDLLAGTDDMDAVNLKQLNDAISKLKTDLQSQINMVTSQGIIPPGYQIQSSVSASVNSNTNGTTSVFSYGGGGILTSFAVDLTGGFAAAFLDVTYSIDGGVSTTIRLSQGISALPTSAWPYVNPPFTGGLYTLFFNTTFKSSLTVQLVVSSSSGTAGIATLYVGYAKKLG